MQFFASPFVASESKATTDFGADLATAPGSPFAIRANTFPPPEGTYAGVVIAPTDVFDRFHSISFSLNGATTTQVTVHSQRPGVSAFNYSRAFASEGMHAHTGKTSGYETVKLDANQLHVVPGSKVDRIVISTNALEKDASFLVSDININGQPVSKSLVESVSTRLVAISAPHAFRLAVLRVRIQLPVRSSKT